MSNPYYNGDHIIEIYVSVLKTKLRWAFAAGVAFTVAILVFSALVFDYLHPIYVAID